MAELQLARSVQPLRLLADQLDDAEVAAARSRDEVERSNDDVRSAGLLGPGATTPITDDLVADLLSRASVRRERLAEVRTLDDQLQRTRERLVATRLTVESASAQARHAEEALTAADTALTTHQQTIAHCQPVAATRAGAVDQVDRARRVCDAARLVEACDRRGVDLEDERRAVTDVELTARATWLDVRQRRIEGMAVELAGDLEPGAPCRVCGSLEHPAPALPGSDHVGEASEDAARAAHEAAQIAQHAVNERLTALTSERAEAIGLAVGLDVAAAEAALCESEQALTNAQDAEVRLVVARQSSVEVTHERDEAAAQRGSARERAAAATVQISELEPRAADLERSIAEVLGDDPDLSSACTRASYRRTVLEAAQRARRMHAQAGAALAELRRRGREALNGSALADWDAVRVALRTDAVVADLEHAVNEYRVATERVKSQLAALAPADQTDVVTPEPDCELDLVGAAAAHADTQTRLTEAADRLAVVRTADAALKRLNDELGDRERLHEPLRREAAEVDELSRCLDGTGGGNARRMRLSAFVLAARLEQVALAASERLLTMSDGRYSLVHSDHLARRGARSGLGLQVLDAWTGVSRDTCTLSGGETFLAALSLALGLADVVQAEAGGASFETLFVDEGFGALDGDTLEEVMGVLDNLRDGGRTVGLVSHVRELRARIPAQVRVRRTPRGSTIEQAGTMIQRDGSDITRGTAVA